MWTLTFCWSNENSGHEYAKKTLFDQSSQLFLDFYTPKWLNADRCSDKLEQIGLHAVPLLTDSIHPLLIKIWEWLKVISQNGECYLEVCKVATCAVQLALDYH